MAVITAPAGSCDISREDTHSADLFPCFSDDQTLPTHLPTLLWHKHVYLTIRTIRQNIPTTGITLNNLPCRSVKRRSRFPRGHAKFTSCLGKDRFEA